MIKNYNENAFNELVNTINKHIDGDSSALPVLVDMITELDKKYPMLKNKFIHDMGSFMTHWFNLINDSKSCSLKLRAKILLHIVMMLLIRKSIHIQIVYIHQICLVILHVL